MLVIRNSHLSIAVTGEVVMGGLLMQVRMLCHMIQFFLLQVLMCLCKGVGWNVQSTTLQIQSPPTGENYCIGCIGTLVDKKDGPNNGTIIAHNEVVNPWSLFTAQLTARGGQPASVTCGGYS